MARILGLLILLVLVILGLSFAVLNSQVVQLNYYLGEAELPLAMVVVAALAVGAVCGLLASMGMVIRSRHEASVLRRKVRVVEKEVSNLRAIPLKDSP